MFEDIVSASTCEGCTPQDATGRKLSSGRLGSSPWEEEKEGQALEGSEMNDLQLSGGKLFCLSELSVFVWVISALTAGIWKG